MLIPAPAASATAPQLRVVAETRGVLFVDKPPGLGFHTEAPKPEPEPQPEPEPEPEPEP